MRREHSRAQIATKQNRNQAYAFTDIRRLIGAIDRVLTVPLPLGVGPPAVAALHHLVGVSVHRSPHRRAVGDLPLRGVQETEHSGEIEAASAPSLWASTLLARPRNPPVACSAVHAALTNTHKCSQ